MAQKRYSIAIVGAGPAGYFAAQALQSSASDERTFAIDMFERLPTPWGLVRSGVAPDHPKIKSVSKVFEKIAKSEGFRLFGNVELGKDLSTDDLRARYDAVIIATGSSIGKKLGIPGEQLAGSHSSAEFVPWYNAHPDFAGHQVDLNTDTAVVIGAGNVAMDVARMLALNPTELDPTDTADHALGTFHQSKIRHVILCARRGPEHAAFTAPELRELAKLEHTNVIIDADEIHQAIARVGENAEKHVASNLDAMLHVAENGRNSSERTLEFRFLLAPEEITGQERVESVTFAHNKVSDDKVSATGERSTVKTGLVISAIGYEAEPIEGITYEAGRVRNENGAVANTNLYVVGWAKRGPSGVIGTNKSDASDVIDLLISQLPVEPKSAGDITELLAGKVVIDQSAWERINAAEVAAGEPLGKPRKKVANHAELVKLGVL
jgi:ferredoxin--NADP+ reductase